MLKVNIQLLCENLYELVERTVVLFDLKNFLKKTYLAQCGLEDSELNTTVARVRRRNYSFDMCEKDKIVF